MRGLCIPVIALLLFSRPGLAEEPGSTPESPVRDESGMEVIVVTGLQPGPGLWKVSNGTHVMWILGEVSPFPRKVRWQTDEFDGLLRDSQELILDFSGYWRSDKNETIAYIRAEDLPKGSLKDVISPQLHKRLQATAKIFGASGLEELRPFAATNRLVVSAMKTMDLTGFSARFSAEALAKKRRVKITYFAAPEPAFAERLKNWQHESNVVCLERLVDAIHDGGNGVKRLGNAWSIGDIPSLRRLVPAYSFSRDGVRADQCAAAMRGGEQQARDYNAIRIKSWLNEAERALRRNRSTMAVVLMSEIFAPDGYLAALRERGYEIIEPE